jgi:predicted signal transduction protein with EAL and GGDEF domain
MRYRFMVKYLGTDVTTACGRALIEERYWSLKRQVPIVYLLGLVNLSAMELATTGNLRLGLNLPTFIAACGVIRIAQWFSRRRHVPHEVMVKRMAQTVWFATRSVWRSASAAFTCSKSATPPHTWRCCYSAASLGSELPTG